MTIVETTPSTITFTPDRRFAGGAVRFTPESGRAWSRTAGSVTEAYRLGYGTGWDAARAGEPLPGIEIAGQPGIPESFRLGLRAGHEYGQAAREHALPSWVGERLCDSIIRAAETELDAAGGAA